MTMTATEFLRHQYKFIGKPRPTLETFGVWEVRGEDSNLDFGGSHYTPLLGYFEGTFLDVYTFATTLKKFNLGYDGGTVELVTIAKIDAKSAKLREQLKKEKQQLEKRLAELGEI